MPWNCLCSNKGRNRRPEISAPILNTEDTQNLQLIPLKHPLITSKRLNEKLVQPENIPCNSPTSSVSVTPSPPPTTPLLQSPAICSDDHQINAFPVNSSNTDNEPVVSHSIECQYHEQHQQRSQENPQKLKKKDIKRIKRLEKKQQKQQQKQLKNNKNKKQQQQHQLNEKNNNSNDFANDDNRNDGNKSNARQSNLKKQSSPSSEVEKQTKTRGVTIITTTFTNNATNGNQTKPLANVKFAFESNDDDNKKNPILNADDEVISLENGIIDEIERINVAATNATSQNNKNVKKILQIDNNGNYDELPLIQIDADVVDAKEPCNQSNEVATNDAAKTVTINTEKLKVQSSGFSRSSSESIPFIDDSPCHFQNNVGNEFPNGSRFIVLQPQNVGSQSIIYARKIEKQSPLASVKPLPKRDQFDKSAQILYQSLKQSIDHHFERVEHLDSKLCQVCHEFLLAPNTVKCLTCGLVCHHSCTLSQKNYEGKQLIPKSQTFPVQSSHHEKTSDHLGLNYVTERILASVLPRRNAPKTSTKAISTINEPEEQIEDRPHNDVPDELPQDIYEQELISMLEQKHGKNYKLFDLESCISTITLEKLCELCKHIDSWLGSGREKVVVLQDRGDRQRLGAAVAAYLEYLGICASNYPHRNGFSNEDASVQNTIARNWLDLDIFSMKKFLEDVIGPLRVPSQRRYLQYFSGLLSGKITVNSSPLYLKYVTIESPPSWYEAEWRSFIKIYEGLNCVFTSDIYVIPITTRQFIYEIGQLRLRGEVIIRCYQLIRPTTNERAYQNSLQQDKRELIFSVQFHTCAITNREVAFYRNDLDFACDDPRFPNDHKVTLHFGDNQTNDNRALYIQSPLVRLEPLTAVAKYNSLENFEDDNSSHTQGPLDGSLYATILKSPKSPLKSPTFPFNLVTNNNTYYNTRNTTSSNSSSSNNNAIDIIVTPSKPQRTGSQQTLISPPPEFSNKKIIEIKECYTTLEPAVNNSNTQTLNRDLIKSNQTSRSYTSTPSYEEIRIPSRSTSRDIILRHQQQQQQTYGHQTTPRPSSSLSSSTYQQHLDLPRRSSSISRSASYTPNNQYSETASQQSRSTENYQYSGSSVQNGTSTIRSTSYQDGRESVKSPLTLSMDSGISSSGINRRIQGSSVSPSSFPSQGSPQDRHQELDDILSDMLLTVQDIPDISKTTRQQYIRKSIQNINLAQSQPTTHHRHHQHHHHHHQYNTVKRSQSYTSQDDTSSNISRNTTGHIRDHCGDFYDTASTTTTLTPTPSESGRDTPLQQQQQHHIYTSTTNIARNNKREQQTLTQSAIEQRERELIMDLQNQSFDYPQPLRTQHSTSSSIDKNNNKKVIYNSATSEDEENIPYHAREDSRPFTYGDPTGVQLSPTNTSGTGMIKLQSGLSSPSLVRKHLGGSTGGLASDSATATRKRNDFEEMLMKRREQILNDKYSRGDRTPNGNSSVNNPNKWNTTTTTTTFNGYPYHEPLKRSNTLDGGFGRGSGYTSDGPSSKTWLQLQQQKLRAKKVQENQDYYATSTYSDTRSRRSRPNAAYRYDGYASDTAAFDVDAFIDEVDYRRPLHVQTPNRSDNNYQTVTTTTTVTQNNNERPFVTVKRAHEQSRGNGIGVREESFSSYRSETEPEISLAGSPRPETPAFPITPRTPYGLNGNVSPALPPKSPTTARKDLYGNQTTIHHIVNQNDNASCYTSRRNSTTSTVNSEPQEIAPHLVKFVRDSSKYWYKPSISREEAVALLRNASPGTFIVRDSTTFAKAYGLVVKVAYPPPGVQSRGTGGDELVRHFLVEPTTRGVRLKGCANEPVFTSLSALVYQHSITPLALPCKLIIPERDIQNIEYHSPAQQQLLQQGAACNVLYLFTCETESLTGPEAVRKAISLLYSRKPLPKPYEVHFKVSHQGITLTDNTRQLFFRKHYPSGNISYCGLDPNDRRWSVRTEGDVPVSNKSIFAFVARRSTSSTDNQCHVFCEMEPNQPATAIVLFANRVIPSYGAQPVSRNI